MNPGIFKTMLLSGMMLAAMLLELTAGAVGWALPLVTPVFYFLTLNSSWYAASFAALAVGAALDLVLGRTFPVSAAALLALTLGSFGLRKRVTSDLTDVLLSLFGAMAAAETVYAVAAFPEYGPWVIGHGIVLTLTGTILALPVIAAGREMMDRIGLPDCFIPRSTIWKKNRLQSPGRGATGHET